MLECRVKQVMQKKYWRNLFLLYVIYFGMSYTLHPKLCGRLRFVFFLNLVKDTEKAFMLGCLSMSSFHQNQSTHASGVSEESVLIQNDIYLSVTTFFNLRTFLSRIVIRIIDFFCTT